MSEPRPRHVLVVCTANICRSPMAEVLLEAEGRRQGRPIKARSGGVMGLIGRPADPKAVKAVGEIGLDLTAHRSKGVDDEDIAWADHVLVMELRHQMELHQRLPQSEGKVLMLGPFAGLHEVADPVGGWIFKFRKSRDQLQRAVQRFVQQMPPDAVEPQEPVSAG
jgi:protein-tyrosine phosphatase